MKKIITEVFEYHELTPKAQEKARQWFRDAIEFFYDNVVEDATQIGGLMGINIDKVFFSGFWSQGDGACFEGNWDAARLKEIGKVKAYAPKDAELHRIEAELGRIAKEFPYSFYRVKHSGHYSHDGCTHFTVEIKDANDDEILSPEANKAADDLIKISRDFMKWIYRTLEKEYEWQFADEQLIDSIKSNGYTFTAEGKRFG
jgi:hypothetical protein